MHFSNKPVTLVLMFLMQVLLPVITSAQNEKCKIINRASAPGESLSYIVSYNVFIFRTDVGLVMKISEYMVLGNSDVLSLVSILSKAHFLKEAKIWKYG